MENTGFGSMSAESLRVRHPTGSVKSRARITHAELLRDPFNAIFIFMLLCIDRLSKADSFVN
jgi:hypothetical protein